MKIKSEKGFTGIDIAISVVVIFIFVSLIAILIYNFNSSSKEVELKAQAVDLAIEEIENMKKIDFQEIENISQVNNNSEYIPIQEIDGKEGFFKRIEILDYNDINSNRTPGIIKKITVQIIYKFKGQEQTIELSTILSKEI